MVATMVDWLPDISQIRVARSYSNAWGEELAPFPFFNDGSAEGHVVRQLYARLEASDVVGEIHGPDLRFLSPSRGLEFKFADGGGLVLLLASDCAAGGAKPELLCSAIPGHVEVVGESGSFRIHSPELADWIEFGWQQDTRLGSPMEAERIWFAN